jgi:hypothetical protein
MTAIFRNNSITTVSPSTGWTQPRPQTQSAQDTAAVAVMPAAEVDTFSQATTFEAYSAMMGLANATPYTQAGAVTPDMLAPFLTGAGSSAPPPALPGAATLPAPTAGALTAAAPAATPSLPSLTSLPSMPTSALSAMGTLGATPAATPLDAASAPNPSTPGLAQLKAEGELVLKIQQELEALRNYFEFVSNMSRIRHESMSKIIANIRA